MSRRTLSALGSTAGASALVAAACVCATESEPAAREAIVSVVRARRILVIAISSLDRVALAFEAGSVRLLEGLLDVCVLRLGLLLRLLLLRLLLLLRHATPAQAPGDGADGCAFSRFAHDGADGRAHDGSAGRALHGRSIHPLRLGRLLGR